MPRPTLVPPACAGALVGRLHRARTATGDHRVAGLDQRRPEPLARGVEGVVGPRAGRAEDADRRAELGQRPEALDELRLDPQHPPRVGVHPVGRARGSPAAAGRWWSTVDLRAAQDGRAAVLLASRPLGRAAVASPARLRASGASRPRTRAAGRSARARRACARTRVAGPVVHRGDAERGEAGDVGPAELRLRRATDGGEERLRRGHGRAPAGHPGAQSVTVDLEAVEELAAEARAPRPRTGRARTGSSPSPRTRRA